MANYQTITGEIVKEDSTSGNKVTYSAVVDTVNFKTNITFNYYEKGSNYAGLDAIYITNNGIPLVQINNPYYPRSGGSSGWNYINNGSISVPYKGDGTLTLNLAMTYKTRGSYPNELFDENGLRIDWINDYKSTVNLPTLYSTKYKIAGIWKNAFAWLKINGIWKHCIVWKKINGTWKKGS